MPNSKESSKTITWDTTPKPGDEVEVRVSVWDSLDIPILDVEGTTDGFVRCFFESNKLAKSTDTHWRNTDGKMSWNWRMNFPHGPKDFVHVLKVQTFDRDIFSSNDLAGEGRIDLEQIIFDVKETKRSMTLSKKYVKALIEDNKTLELS